MTILLGILFWIVLMAAIAIIPLGLPGTFVIAGATLFYGMLTDFSSVTVGLVTVLFAVAILLELMEFALAGYMAGKFGGSRTAIVGAVIGGFLGAIIGTVVLPVIGTLFGAFIGAFAGAFIGELTVTTSVNAALLAGIGATLGAIGGKLTKVIAAIGMVVTVGVYFF